MLSFRRINTVAIVDEVKRRMHEELIPRLDEELTIGDRVVPQRAHRIVPQWPAVPHAILGQPGIELDRAADAGHGQRRCRAGAGAHEERRRAGT